MPSPPSIPPAHAATPQPPLPVPQRPAAPPPPKPLPVKVDASVQSLLSLTHGSSFLPEDFDIGELEGVGLTPDQSAAQAAAVTFLVALAKGKVATDLLDSASAAALGDSLTYYLGKGDVPDSYLSGRTQDTPDKPGAGGNGQC